MGMHNAHAKTGRANGLLISLAGGLAGGFLIWFLSPIITGQQEAWDAGNGYYLCSLCACGIIFSLYSPRYFWAVAIGVFVGQLVYILLILEHGYLHPLGMLFCFFDSLIALWSGMFVFIVQKLLEHAKPSTTTTDVSEALK